MSVDFAHRNPLLYGLQESSQATVIVEAAAGRYIHKLEIEVESLTRQCDAACALLYKAVWAQDISGLVIEELTSRGFVVEAEAASRSEILHQLLHYTHTNSLQRLQLENNNNNKKSSFSLITTTREGEGITRDWRELPQRIAEALHRPLQEENEKITQLVESVPQRVCVALSSSAESPLASEKVGVENSTTVLQQLAHIMRRVDELATRINIPQLEDNKNNNNATGDHEYNDNERDVTVQGVVRSLDESTRRIEEVINPYINNSNNNISNNDDVSRSQALQSTKKTHDLSLMQKCTYSAFKTLESMISEYIFVSEQMQIMEENEANIVLLVSEKNKKMYWNRLLEEKDSEIRRLRDEVKKIKNEANNRNNLITTSNSIINNNNSLTENNKPTLAQLYAKFSAPFIPEKVRHVSTVKLQSFEKLRKQALRVGAREATFMPIIESNNTIVNNKSTNTTITTSKKTEEVKINNNNSKTPEITVVKPFSSIKLPEEKNQTITPSQNFKSTVRPSEETTTITKVSEINKTQNNDSNIISVSPTKVRGINVTIRQLRRSLSTSSSSSSVSFDLPEKGTKIVQVSRNLKIEAAITRERSKSLNSDTINFPKKREISLENRKNLSSSSSSSSLVVVDSTPSTPLVNKNINSNKVSKPSVKEVNSFDENTDDQPKAKYNNVQEVNSRKEIDKISSNNNSSSRGSIIEKNNNNMQNKKNNKKTEIYFKKQSPETPPQSSQHQHYIRNQSAISNISSSSSSVASSITLTLDSSPGHQSKRTSIIEKKSAIKKKDSSSFDLETPIKEENENNNNNNNNNKIFNNNNNKSKQKKSENSENVGLASLKNLTFSLHR